LFFMACNMSDVRCNHCLLCDYCDGVLFYWITLSVSHLCTAVIQMLFFSYSFLFLHII
jgi:hypothetical protein